MATNINPLFDNSFLDKYTKDASAVDRATASISKGKNHGRSL